MALVFGALVNLLETVDGGQLQAPGLVDINPSTLYISLGTVVSDSAARSCVWFLKS